VLRQREMLMRSISTLFITFVAKSELSAARAQLHPAFFMSSNGGGDQSQRKEIYKVSGSGWASPKWNWGSANGTGHDCAMVCRERLNSRETRADLVNNLLNPPEVDGGSMMEEIETSREPPFEEVKLILALSWQRGRWDGTDGGIGGYGEVLSMMAKANRYESEDKDACSKALVQDMMARFHLIASESAVNEMDALSKICSDIDILKRKCSGLVLREMGFIENGL